MYTNDAAIVVKNLKKSFKGVSVLNGLDFYVKPSTIFTLLGSNGSGKTTTVRILCTLLTMDEGQVTIHNIDLSRCPRKVREKISLTGQYAAVDEAQTGRENLQMMSQLRHMKNAEQVINELLSRFDLIDAADRRVATYSGGMRRKLDLAMSLLGNPSVIFLDEPTTGLDPQSRLTMWGIIKTLAKQGTTIFLTTQYLEEAERLADYIAILHGGKIIAEGTVEELKEMFPPAIVEYVEKRPSLEDVFLAIIEKNKKEVE